MLTSMVSLPSTGSASCGSCEYKARTLKSGVRCPQSVPYCNVLLSFGYQAMRRGKEKLFISKGIVDQRSRADEVTIRVEGNCTLSL